MRKYIVAIYLALVFMSIIISFTHAQTLSNSDSDNYYFYIYGTHDCPHCNAMEKFLVENFGREKVFFCDVEANTTCRNKFIELINMGLSGNVPTIFIVYDYNISAVIIGEYEKLEDINNLLKPNNSSKIPVYVVKESGLTGDSYLELYGYLELNTKHVYFIANYLCCDQYCSSLINANESSNVVPKFVLTKAIGFFDILLSLFVLALIDSINPCTLVLYFSFISMCLIERKTIGPPLVFLIIIYFGYLLFALLLFRIAVYVPAHLFIILAFIIGMYNIFSSGREKRSSVFKCSWCEKLSKISKLLQNKYMLALVLSTFSVVVLLPCTSGPLLLFISLLRNSSWEIFYPAILLYNVVFLSPMIILYVATIYLGREKKIALWLKNNSQVLEFLSGVLLLLVAFVLLISTI